MNRKIRQVCKTLTKNGARVSTVYIPTILGKSAFYETTVFIRDDSDVVSEDALLPDALRAHEREVSKNGGRSWRQLLGI